MGKIPRIDHRLLQLETALGREKETLEVLQRLALPPFEGELPSTNVLRQRADESMQRIQELEAQIRDLLCGE